MKTYVAAVLSGVALANACCEKRTDAPAMRPSAIGPVAAPTTPTTLPVYHARGRVVAVSFSKAGRGVSVVVDHEDIPGLMDAMRMEFRLASPELVGGLHPGGAIAFDLAVQPEGDLAVTRGGRPGAGDVAETGSAGVGCHAGGPGLRGVFGVRWRTDSTLRRTSSENARKEKFRSTAAAPASASFWR